MSHCELSVNISIFSQKYENIKIRVFTPDPDLIFDNSPSCHYVVHNKYKIIY